MFTPLLGLLDQLAQQPALVTLVMGAAALAESALGLGTLTPGETMVSLGAGVLAGQPVLSLAWAAVAVGAFLGDHVGYLVGRRSGPALATGTLVRRLGAHRWQRATALIERHGVPTLVLGRLVPGVRTVLAAGAGALGMSYRRYVLAAALAALLWSALWVGGGATMVTLVLGLGPLHALALGAALAGVVTGIAVYRRARRAAALA
ncbi:DedA family protein [Georgenia sp. H159]|uniref:DedA family protein n=1 Tax=Georgenia sp. H159 TaxID=3076115 RepID=UPI002D78C069|nr:DedA family protein [Georgenia sp. H159]